MHYAAPSSAGPSASVEALRTRLRELTLRLHDPDNSPNHWYAGLSDDEALIAIADEAQEIAHAALNVASGARASGPGEPSQ